MARDGSGNYTLPANTQAVSGDPISSTKYNTLVQDLEADANVDRPVAAGGTGASTALAARANLGLEIGTDVQAFDAGLQSIAGLTTVADRSIYTTASDTYAVYTLTAAGRAILDDADAAAQRTTLGLGTAALKNTGTSGDAVPLLNAANTFSAAQTLERSAGNEILLLSNTTTTHDLQCVFINSGTALSFRPAPSGSIDATKDFYYDFTNNRWTFDEVPYVATNTIWHAGNDGAGSGLDADSVDGAHVGTSGAKIPLTNGTNIWSGTSNSITSLQPLIYFNETDGAVNEKIYRIVGTGGQFKISTMTDASAFGADVLAISRSGTTATSIAMTATAVTINGGTVWHAGNDGAGSGLDADTLDGVQGSAYGQLSSAQTWSAVQTFSAANPIILNSAAGTQRFFLLRSGGALRWAFGADSDAESGSNVGSSFLLYSYNDAGTFLGTALRVARGSLAATFGGALSATTIHARPLASTETSGTLTSASANKTIQLTGNPTINNSVFAAGDIIVMYAGASARTITAGTITTMRLDGTATTGSRTLAARGIAMLFFVSATEVIVAGGAVT